MASLESIINNVRDKISLIRSDPESTAFWRSIAIAGLSCLMISYAGFSLYIEPQKKLFDKKYSAIEELKLANPGLADDSLLTAIPKMEQRIQNLHEQIKISSLKEKVLREQRQAMSDPELFTRVIFTLNPSAPVRIGSKLKQMDNLAPRDLENFRLHPMTIAGEADFASLLNYIKYLESSQEVAFMDDLLLENKSKSGKVGFSLLVGRLELKNQTGS